MHRAMQRIRVMLAGKFIFIYTVLYHEGVTQFAGRSVCTWMSICGQRLCTRLLSSSAEKNVDKLEDMHGQW
jgi:hypothetical protein